VNADVSVDYLPCRDGVSRVKVRPGLIEFGDSDLRRGRGGEMKHVVVQNADDNGRAGLGTYYTARTSLEA
jgi:hypothetical protein